MKKPGYLHFLSIFIISFSTLCIELLFTRALSFVFWNHVVYLIITLALLGYGISSTFIIIKSEKLKKYPSDIFISISFILFSVSILLSLFSLKYLNNTLINTINYIFPPYITSFILLLLFYFLFLILFFF
jgi:hypothetical protein